MAMGKLLLHQAKTHDESQQKRLWSSQDVSEEGHGPNIDHQNDHHRGNDVRLFTTQFEDIYDWENVYPFRDDPQTFMNDPVVVLRLETFTTSMSSQILYFYDDPGAADHPQFLQQAVCAYISLARDQRIPVVSYFYTLSYERPPRNRTRESTELCAAMYSMLKQLINLLPSDFVARKGMFTDDALKELDGTLKIWNLALELFVESVDCLKLPLLLFVVGGLNLVEDDPRSYTHTKATSLVCQLRSVVEAQRKGRVIKVLFSTAGLSHVLSSQLEDAESMCCRVPTPDSSSGILNRVMEEYLM